MKHAFILLIIAFNTSGMIAPGQASNELTQVPFGQNTAQLISLAESMVIGTLTPHSCSEQRSVYFEFNNYRDPKISYKAMPVEVWNATRFIAAYRIRTMMAHQAQTDSSHPDSLSDEEKARFKGYAQARRYEADRQLALLNVSPLITECTTALSEWEKTFQETSITNADTNQVKALKTKKMIDVLESLKDNPAFAQEIAFTRFYRFWKGEDLKAQTKKDYSRDLENVRAQRNIFFRALEEQDITNLATYQPEKLLKKQPRTLGQTIQNMIELLKKNRHLDGSSPQNSDEEIF